MSVGVPQEVRLGRKAFAQGGTGGWLAEYMHIVNAWSLNVVVAVSLEKIVMILLKSILQKIVGCFGVRNTVRMCLTAYQIELRKRLTKLMCMLRRIMKYESDQSKRVA